MAPRGGYWNDEIGTKPSKEGVPELPRSEIVERAQRIIDLAKSMPKIQFAPEEYKGR